MNTDDQDRSLGDAATFAGSSKRRSADVSLGDERTLGGGDAAGLDTVIDDIEVVDLEARYTIEGTLGQGGMGAVVLALDRRLDRKVAIKRILGEAARSKTAIMRFLTEAKAIAALNHPNIVQIYDYGRAKDGPFLIMEYVDGGSVADRCKQGALPLDETVSLACQICDGLAKAHDAGIVHRDIKPANVLLNRDGHPKLTDFGLAKAEAVDHGMTMTGAVMGTPDFMPPEQRRDASEVDHRSDLWSLAATVYQIATGRSPKIIRFDLLPAELTKVLGKALEEEKEARYQSVREFRDALKTTARAAAVAVHDAVEGACVDCGVQNDPSRKFCRGCGESLVAPCLRCDVAIPVWDEICGACGAKQTPLADERRRSMAARQAKAEGLLGDFEFDRAAAIAAELRDESHPKLKHLSGWATTFLEQTKKARTEQIAKAVEAIRQATKHEAAYDHHSAVAALETVPASLADAVLPGLAETAQRMLDRIQQKQGEVRRLERLIKDRIAAKQLDELLPEVEKLLGLQPDRKDVRKIRGQLVERAERQAQSLARVIKDAVAANQLDGLIEAVDRYLRLKPADAEITALQQSLVERNKTTRAQAREQDAAQRLAALKTHFESALKQQRFGTAKTRLDEIFTQVKPESPTFAEAERMRITYDSKLRWAHLRRSGYLCVNLSVAVVAILLFVGMMFSYEGGPVVGRIAGLAGFASIFVFISVPLMVNDRLMRRFNS